MNMKVDLAGVTLNNPIMTASLTCGSGGEFAAVVDLTVFGALLTQGVANIPWVGKLFSMVASVYGGMLK